MLYKKQYFFSDKNMSHPLYRIYDWKYKAKLVASYKPRLRQVKSKKQAIRLHFCYFNTDSLSDRKVIPLAIVYLIIIMSMFLYHKVISFSLIYCNISFRICINIIFD